MSPAVITRRRSLGQAAAWVAAAMLGVPPSRGFAQTGAAASAAFPSRPLRLLVGFSAGGGADAIARTVAARLATQLGQNMVVENRPGASSTIAAGVLAESPADGYTLMLADSDRKSTRLNSSHRT